MSPLRRVPWPLLAVALASLTWLVSSCGESKTPLEDYAGEVESLVAEMNREVDDAAALIDGSVVSVADVAEAFSRRAEARSEFLAGLEGLDPPEEAADLHGEALVIVAQLRDAEQAVADRAGVPGIGVLDVLDSLEAERLDDIDARAVELCSLAEAAFDATAVREGFSGSTWMPAALKEAVDVAFQCTQQERERG